MLHWVFGMWNGDQITGEKHLPGVLHIDIDHFMAILRLHILFSGCFSLGAYREQSNVYNPVAAGGRVGTSRLTRRRQSAGSGRGDRQILPGNI